MIDLPNRVSFRWKIASGALGYDGKGWWWDHPYRWFGLLKPELFLGTTKSLTRYPRKGNLRWHHMFGFGCVQQIKKGWVNAVGLSNPGIEYWCKKVGPKVSRDRLNLAVSIVGTVEELAEMTDMLNQFDIAAIEVNVSCPNTGDMPTLDQVVEGVCAVRQRSKHPIIFKGSVVQDIFAIAKEISGMVSAIELNSVPWNMVLMNRNPVQRFNGGGVSGEIAQAVSWPILTELVGMKILPVIGSHVAHYSDVPFLFDRVGVQAISFGVIHIPNMWRPRTWLNPIKPTLYIRRFEEIRNHPVV